MILNAEFFSANRKKLLQQLDDDALVIVAANGLMQRTGDTEYKFDQERSFFYLSGLNEPGWLLVFSKGEEFLVAPDLSEIEQVFNGRIDEPMIKKDTGVESIMSFSAGWKEIKKLLQNKVVYTIRPPEPKFWQAYSNPSRSELVKKLGVETKDITRTVLRMRTIKQKPEIKALRKAISITKLGFDSIKGQLDELESENETEGIFTALFRKHNADHAYTPIVASGANAYTVHYIKNNQPVGSNSLLLMDVGAAWENYASDVTRTYPVGKPDTRKNEVLVSVREAFDEILSFIKPGLKLVDYSQEVDKIMANKIADLGLGSDPSSLRKYFPYSPSHGLGLDVHDPIVGFDSLQPGMVITLEPGIHIEEEGIGVRHEDDLLITKSGAENLSQQIPR